MCPKHNQAKFLTKKNSSIPTLKNGERVVENVLDKATLLNSYFSQCFNQSVSPLTDDDISMFDSTNPLLFPEEFLCTEDEVLEMLLSLDTKKANGRDGISARMLKSTAPSIACCCLTIPFLQEKYLELGRCPHFPEILAIRGVQTSKEFSFSLPH